MKSPATRIPVIVVVAVGMAIIPALLLWRPAVAPTADGSAGPATSAAASALPTQVPSADGPAGVWQVSWDEPIVQPFGERDVLLRIDGMVGSPDLLLGWGRTPMPGRNQFNDMGAVFASPDGVRWRTVPVEHGVNAVNASTINDIAVGPDGFLAVGSVCCEPEQGAIWRSRDGLAWERIEVAGALEAGGQPYRIVASPGGWVVLEGRHAGSALLHSADGVTWSTVLESEANRVSGGILAITQGPGGLLAVGTADGPDGTYDGAVWRSEDGVTWERMASEDAALAGAGEVYLHDVVGHAGGYLASGLRGTAEQRRTCEEMALLATTVDLPASPPEFATSCVLGDEAQWVSTDGISWQRVVVDAKQVRPIEFRLARPGGPGLLVLGEGSGAESPDTMLFGSSDGVRWEVLSNAEPMLRDVAVALVVREDAILAVTESWAEAETTYRVWTGHNH
jgi:hypothetical protein